MSGPGLMSDKPATLAGGPAQRQERRRELDWLRAFVVFGLIPFHTAVIFIGAQGDYVRNAQSSWLLARLVAFITFWGIPLLFFVSGAATRYTLAARDNRQYISERITRLLVPFIFAMLTIMPVQVYVGYLGTPGPHVSFWQYYGQFMQSLLGILHGAMPARGADWIGHLWFIPPLLAISVIMLPLFRFLRSPRGERIINSLDGVATLSMALILFGLPFGLAEVILRVGWPIPGSAAPEALDNWPGFVIFGLFYIGGFIVYSEPHIQRGLRAWWAPALALGVVTWLLVEGAGAYASVLPGNNFWFEALIRLLRGYVSWFWVAAIVGFGLRYLTSSGRVVRYLTEATFPIYVLHMPILTIIGYYVVRWPAGIAFKFIFISVAAMIVTILLFEVFVRHVAPLRFVFGMSVRPRGEPQDKAKSPHTTRSRPERLSIGAPTKYDSALSRRRMEKSRTSQRGA
ncbi:MAG TPA: acyltransferase family protein [Ktedonobacterales bacterium]